MNNKLLLSALAVAGTVAFAGSTFAFMGNGGNNGPRNIDTASQEQVQEAISNGDYSTFQSLISDSNRASNMTEERFNSMVERHQEREVKQTEREEFREKNQAAITDGDYDAWKALQEEDSEMLKVIDTEDKFEKLVELHELREQATNLAKELGLPERGMKNNQDRMGKKGMRGGNGQHQENGQKRGNGQGQRNNGGGMFNFGN